MPHNSTLPEISRLWLHESLGVFSQETLDHYSVLIDTQFIPHFGNSVEISQTRVEEFMQAKKEGGLSEGTVFTLVKLLQRILQYGAGHGYCPMPDLNLKFHTPQKKHAPGILFQEEARRAEFQAEQEALEGDNRADHTPKGDARF